MADKVEGNVAADTMFDETPETSGGSAISGGNEFFDALDQNVNGMVTSASEANDVSSTQVTQPKPNVDTGIQQGGHQDTDWKKRYSDSTREAQNMRQRLNELEPYSGLLDVMRKDPNLISTVRDYLQNGGNAPQDLQKQMDLPDDFEFDANEAFNNPESKSAQVFDGMMNNYVTQRVGEVINQEKQQAAQTQVQLRQQMEAKAFKEKNGLTDAQMEDFMKRAKEHTLTLDDAWLVVNRENRDNKIAKAQSAEMRKQMKNVNAVPNSVSTQNNQGQSQNPADSVFDALLGDGNVDNLFGNN